MGGNNGSRWPKHHRASSPLDFSLFALLYSCADSQQRLHSVLNRRRSCYPVVLLWRRVWVRLCWLAAPNLNVSTYASVNAGTQSQVVPRADAADPAGLSDTVSLPTAGISAADVDANGAITASASNGARAEFGNLHAYVSASAASHTAWAAQGDASAEAHFRDTLFVPATLAHPAGTSVKVWLRMVIDCPRDMTLGLPDNSTRLEAKLFVTDYSTQWQAAVDDIWNYQPQWDILQASWLDVGKTYTLGGDLKIGAAFTVPDGGPWTGSASLDVWNTSHNYVYADDPAVTLLSGTGTTYAVPEPGSLAAIGTVCLIVLRRRR